MKENVVFKSTRSPVLLKRRTLLGVFFQIFILTSIACAQDLEVSGKITSTDGKPIPGATIVIQGTAIGTASDMDGNFKIKVPEGYKDSTLSISSMGFTLKQVKINGQTSINVSLAENTKILNEVVVVGYGTQKRSDLTGSISSVTGEDIQKATVLGVEQALQGRASGVQITQNTGSPGSNSSVRIRGVGTVGNSNPLYVVDGLPMSDISFLNPNDIASIDVLKDASASAIYGSRAANGVVLVTTRQGKEGKTTISFDTYTGIQSAWKTMNLLSAEQWAILKNEARLADGNNIETSFADPASLGSGTDWQKEIFRTAPMSNYQLSVNGGTEKNQFSISGNYFKQAGIIKATDADRISFRINASQQAAPKLKIGENINLTHSERNNILENEEFNSVINQALTIDPITPVTNPDGSYASSSYTNIKNPVALIANTNSLYKSNRLVGGLYGEYEFIKGLKFKSNVGLDLSLGNFYGFTPTYNLAVDEQNLVSTVTRNYDQWTTGLWDNTLTYATTINKKHTVEALAGISAQEGKYENIFASRNGTPTNDANVRYLDAGTTTPAAFGGASEWALFSYLGRVNYAYDGKYLLTTNVRIDQSSRFLGKNRSGVFPSLSLGWKITEENFMKQLPVISTLKLRTGWGQIGNQDIGSVYPYTTTIAPNQSYTLGATSTKVSGSAPLTAGNNEIKWETVTQTNIGLDMGFFEDRITLSADYYIKNTSDMLVRLPIPAYVGTGAPYVNAGTVRNNGLELSAMYRKSEGTLKYNAGFNISFVHNEVTSLGEGGEAILTGDFRGIGKVSRTEVGQPIASFYGYVTDGLFQNDAEVAAGTQPNAKPGDIRFKDLNGDGVITDKDRDFIGSPIPDFTYGISGGAEYKGFDMTIFFQGSQGNKIFNGNKYYLEGGVGYTNMSNAMLGRWTGDGSSTTTPRMTENDKNDNRRLSDRYVEDGSYLRIKNLQIGYTLSKGIMKYAHIQKLRLYVSAQNLLTITKYTGYDPEIGQGRYGGLDVGIDRGVYPQARTISIGANLTF